MLTPSSPVLCISDAVSANVGERNAVLIILIPNVIPDNVGCLQKVINANTLHPIAMNIPTTGTKIDIAAKINATIDNAFIFTSTFKEYVIFYQTYIKYRLDNLNCLKSVNIKKIN